MKITQTETLAVLESIEGARWIKETMSSDAAHSLRSVMKRWQAFKDDNADSSMSFNEYSLIAHDVKDGDVVYGAGGHTRYIVTSKGDVAILAWSADGHPDKLRKARESGMRVVGR